MHKYTTFLLFLVLFIGTILSYAQIFPVEENESYPLIGSYYYIGTSLVMVFLLIKSEEKISKAKLWTNNFIIVLFVSSSILLSLICFYSLPLKEVTLESLGGSIFFLCGMIVGSVSIFINARVRTAQVSI